MNPKIETKTVKHLFSPEELLGIGRELSQALTQTRLIEEEFDEVKASYKAKGAEADAKVGRLSSQIESGFDLRPTRCRVAYRPKDRKKDYFPEESPDGTDPVLTEEMSPEDFQQDLIQCEGRFDLREEIDLFPATGGSRGIMVVGRLKGRWYSALRINVGAQRIEERLDAEQKSMKARPDAVRQASKRAQEWLLDTLGRDNAQGFKDPIFKAVEAHLERTE